MTDIFNVQLDEHTVHPIDLKRFREKTADSAELKMYVTQYIKNLQHSFKTDPLIQTILKGTYQENDTSVEGDLFLETA